MSDNISYVAKWLDPIVHPIPKDKRVLAYVKMYHYEVSKSCTIVCLEPLNDDSGYTHGTSSPTWANGIDKEDIIAWMPLRVPSLPRKGIGRKKIQESLEIIEEDKYG